MFASEAKDINSKPQHTHKTPSVVACSPALEEAEQGWGDAQFNLWPPHVCIQRYMYEDIQKGDRDVGWEREKEGEEMCDIEHICLWPYV